MAAEGSTKAVVTAMVANGGIAVAKFVAFLVTGASSMLAEAVHSVADTSNQALLLFGGKRARRVATPTHPFGYGRERYFWSFVVAMILFSLGGMFALYEGILKLRDPHEISSPGWAIGVLLVAVVFESFAMRTAIAESQKVKGDASWVQFVRRSRSPELPVILLEDAGALIGLVLALAGVGLTLVTGNTTFDALGTCAIGVLLVLIAIVLAVEMKSLLIGESATDADLARVETALVADPRVRSLIHLRTQHLGPDELLVGAKLELDADLTVADVAATIDAVEADLRASVPIATVIYLEPDLRHAAGDA